MAEKKYNIKQITNFDILDKQVVGEYKVANVPDSKKEEYVHIEFEAGKKVMKLGYCCEPKAIGYPIILYFNSTNGKIFEVGKTGMFEIQVDTFKNKIIDTENNKEIIEEIDIQIDITGIDVPKNLNFVLDYAYLI